MSTGIDDPTGSVVWTSLPPWVVASAAAVDLNALCEVVVRADIDAAFMANVDDLEFVRALRASVRENLDALQRVLCGRISLQDVRLEHVLAFGEIQAQLRDPQRSLQRSYRVGFLAMWEEWARQLQLRAVAADVSRDEATSALTTLTRMLFAYQDHVASQVVATFTRADEALSRSRAHVRQQLVRVLLDGDGDNVAPSDLMTIGYEFERNHLAILLPRVAEGAAGQLVLGLRAAVPVLGTLVHPLSLSSSVIFLAKSASWVDSAIDVVLGTLAKAGVVASISDPASSLGGFRRAYEQAMEVETVRQAWDETDVSPLIRYADVALDILLTRDPAEARRFVTRELGPLADSTNEGARLRETLAASFRHGSHVAAATELQVHEHTIRNRLRRIEELLGHQLSERRTEMQVALRIQRVLSD